jgi:ribonuclease Z
VPAPTGWQVPDWDATATFRVVLYPGTRSGYHDGMKLVPLGTTGYHPNELRQTACYMLPESGAVFDAGTGAHRLAKYLVGDELDLFLSHAHLDHIIGLTFLLETFHQHPMRRATVHGDPRKLAAVREHLFHVDLFPVPIPVEWRALAKQVPLRDGGVVTHFPLTHPGGSLGFRVDWPGKSLAYVTDTTASSASNYVESIRGVDLLLHECNFSDDEIPPEFAVKTGHSQTSQVAELAKRADVGRLVLIHIAPHHNRVDPVGVDKARKIFAKTEIAEDCKAIEF